MGSLCFIITCVLVITVTAASGTPCGRYRSHANLVVGGRPVLDPTDWPWIVGLFVQGEASTTFQCGATLVSKNVVVTAAHCVRFRGHTLPKQDLTLVMGRTRVQNWRDQQNVQIRNVIRLVIHPSYLQSSTRGADLAYLELDSPVEITQTVMPVCLWKEDSDHLLTGRNGTVVGWGRDEHDNYVTETPRKVKLPIVDKQVCLDSNVDFHSFVSNFTFCAGNRDGTGPCNGDSGSGMYVRRTLPDGTKSWVLRGIVSRSILLDEESQMCDLRHYVVFTDMTVLKPWLPESCTFKHARTFALLNSTIIGDRYYYLNEDENKMLNWTSAQQFCRSHGLQLAIIETKRENDLIAEHLRGKISRSQSIWDFWLGGNRSQQERTWRWTSGQTINFTNWMAGLPDHRRGDEDCMAMFVLSNGQHDWFDQNCSVKLRFLCEWEDVCT